MVQIVLLLLVGFAALYFGAEWLVRGGASLAVRLGMTPVVAGLTVVAFGTSAPELVVSVMAALDGRGDIAVGNVVGSNIFNIGLILGLTAVIRPLRVEFQLLKFDTPVMMAATLLFLWCFRDGAIGRGQGVIFVMGIVAYTVTNVILARRQASGRVVEQFQEQVPPPTGSPGQDVVLILIGVPLLVAGSRLFVLGASDLARFFGVSEAVIGLTVVAAGTSLPELAASVTAVMRKNTDIAIGNIIGSNIFNVLAIVGVSSIAAGRLEAAGITAVDLGVMFSLSLTLLPMVWTGSVVRRWEGIVLLLIFFAYQIYLWPK
jgi:cation:H+ antiporter